MGLSLIWSDLSCEVLHYRSSVLITGLKQGKRSIVGPSLSHLKMNLSFLSVLSGPSNSLFDNKAIF